MELTPEQKAAAIAVIFYKGTDCSNDDGSGELATRTLGVGLKLSTEKSLNWSSSNAATSMTAIQCNNRGYDLDFVSAPDKNGSDNLDQIASYLGANDDTDNPDNYPAFWWAKKYSDTETVLNETEYESGWYLPSSIELLQVFYYKEQFNVISNLCDGNQFGDFMSSGNGGFWSSSTIGETSRACVLFYSNSSGTYPEYRPLFSNESYGSYQCVCAIHEF